jgi:hypothetical protein
MKELAMHDIDLISSKKIENCGYIPALGLPFFLRIMVMNPKNSPDNY